MPDDCVLDIGGFCIVHPRGACYGGEKKPTTVVTIRLTKEAAERLLANPPTELAGYKVLSIEPIEDK